VKQKEKVIEQISEKIQSLSIEKAESMGKMMQLEMDID
jgi:hypothetical protein